METLKVMLTNLQFLLLGLVNGILVFLSGLVSVYNTTAAAYFSRDEFATSEIGNRPSPLLVPVPLEFTVESAMGQIPVLKWADMLKRPIGSHDDQEDERCVVCLARMMDCDEVREIRSCSHVFHKECLDAWIDKGKLTCPLCRSNMLPREKLIKSGGDPWRRERMIYLFGEDTTF